MSARAGNQYSPEQILEAGQRAEAEGRTEYALQFYRHLAQHYHGTVPARHAVDALARLEALEPAPAAHGPNGSGVDFTLQPQPRPANAQGDSGRRIGIAPAGVARTEPVELPAPIADYRAARWMARAITWLGWPLLLAGLGMAVAAIAAPAALSKLPLIGALFSSPGTGGTIAAAGLAMVIGGQLVRAHLDLALATRNMAALLRVQAEANGGVTAGDDAPKRRRRKRQG